MPSHGSAIVGLDSKRVAWPSGLRRWFKAPVSSEAWVRIPPLPECFFHLTAFFGRAVGSVRGKKFQGTHGFEPWTYRTAADCSTTELYPQLTVTLVNNRQSNLVVVDRVSCSE